MIKRFLLIAVVLVLSSTVLTASDTQEFQQSSEVSYSPQVCQYSLSRYTGTTDVLGNTEYFTVGLSCPQTEDTYATVVAFFNDEHAGSIVVKVPANKTQSASARIALGSANANKSYKLVVQ